MSLRVHPHPRGHIASCNGSLEQLEARVECDLQNPRLSASERAALVEEWSRKETERKALRLARFQKEVKGRVTAREKVIQREMAVASSRAMRCEQEAAERAMRLDNSTKDKDKDSVAKGHDVEDVIVMASGRDSHFSRHQGPSALQAARNTLLSQSRDYEYETITQHQAKRDVAIESPSGCHLTLTPSRKPQGPYDDVAQLSPEKCSRRLSLRHVANTYSWQSLDPKTSPTAKKFTAPGQVEHMERIHAGKQYLVFRRLYSDLEREQVRRRKVQSAHSRHVKMLKKRKEADRKRLEEEMKDSVMESASSSSVISTSTSEERVMAAEWAELVLQEERKQELQKARETERFMAALKERLKEQVALKRVEVPPLCSCARTIWDTSPETCANNCVFYKNTKAYVKALSNLLQSLNI